MGNNLVALNNNVPEGFLTNMRQDIILGNSVDGFARNYDGSVNCYSAALGIARKHDIGFVSNVELRNVWYTPGIMSGYMVNRSSFPNDLKQATFSDMDAVKVMIKQAEYDSLLEQDERLIAMFYRYCPHTGAADYHFMWRGAKDSTWLHRPGPGFDVERVDNLCRGEIYTEELGCYKMLIK